MPREYAGRERKRLGELTPFDESALANRASAGRQYYSPAVDCENQLARKSRTDTIDVSITADIRGISSLSIGKNSSGLGGGEA